MWSSHLSFNTQGISPSSQQALTHRWQAGHLSHMSSALRSPAKTPVAGWRSRCPLFPWGTGSLALPAAPAGPWASRRWTAAVTRYAQGPSGPAAGQRGATLCQRGKTSSSYMWVTQFFVMSFTATKLLLPPFLQGILKEPHCGKVCQRKFHSISLTSAP